MPIVNGLPGAMSLPNATHTTDGLMSKNDKQKLDKLDLVRRYEFTVSKDSWTSKDDNFITNIQDIPELTEDMNAVLILSPSSTKSELEEISKCEVDIESNKVNTITLNTNIRPECDISFLLLYSRDMLLVQNPLFFEGAITSVFKTLSTSKWYSFTSDGPVYQDVIIEDLDVDISNVFSLADSCSQEQINCAKECELGIKYCDKNEIIFEANKLPSLPIDIKINLFRYTNDTDNIRTSIDDLYERINNIKIPGEDGSLSSLAQVASTGEYSDLKNIPSTFTPSEHTHNEYALSDHDHINKQDKTYTSTTFIQSSNQTLQHNFDYRYRPTVVDITKKGTNTIEVELTDKTKFLKMVKNKYGVYNFTYKTDEWTNPDGDYVDLKTTYGITVIGTPTDNDEIIVTVSNNMISMNIKLPDTIVNDFICSLSFLSGETPTSIIYPDTIKWSGDDISLGKFVPSKNTVYNIIIWYDGFNVNAITRGVSA